MKLKEKIFSLSIATALLLLILIAHGNPIKGKYISDSNGNITGILRGNLDKNESYSLNLVIRGDGINDKRVVDFNFSGKLPKSKGKNNIKDNEAIVESEIQRIINEIELSKGKKIILPSRLNENINLRWYVRENEGNGRLVIVVFIYIALLVIIIKDEKNRKNSACDVVRKNILRSLPRFCNQLLLMMNAGMTLRDSFENICKSYEKGGVYDESSFETMIINSYQANKIEKKSTAHLLMDFAQTYNVKELIRIAAILDENENRGSDVIESLKKESEFLWDDRKIIARETGKMIDTKMAYPMAMLLLILIVITITPALINI